jgi:ATP-binding cassette, subfamily B, bacterial
MNPRFKKFLSYYRPHMKIFTLVMGCALVSAGVTLTIPLVSRFITKQVLAGATANALPQILEAGGLMLLLILLLTVCNMVYCCQGHIMGAKMETVMRAELFAHYEKLSFRFYDGQKIGRMMSILSGDVLSMTELYHHGPEDVLMFLIKFVGAFVVLMSINVPLTIVTFSLLPLMVLYALHFSPKMKAAYKRSRERIADVNAQVEDSLSGIRVVQSFTNEEIEQQKFDRENQRFLLCRKDVYKNEAFFYDVMTSFPYLFTLVILVFGGICIINGTMDLADLLAFTLYIGSLFEPINTMLNFIRLYQEGSTGFARFMEMLETNPDISDREDAVSLSNIQGRIAFENVTFGYQEDQEPVLADFSLDAKAGESVAVVGSSGVGKTTLCSLIPRFYDVTEGRILLDGADVRNIRLKDLRKNIGVVQQDVYLFSGTVLENIRYGRPDAAMEEVMEAARQANAHDFIQKLPNGYDTDIGSRGVKLSGGQKQRISIARVFLKNPPVLILDEATSALDNESERMVQESIERLMENRTTFIIAHRLSTIQNAKRIIVLEEKQVVEEGNHTALVKKGGAYAKLYRAAQVTAEG